MSARSSQLVQILLPKETGCGQPISKEWFDGFLKKLTEKFGGATSFVRSPGQGLWQSGGATEKDNIAVIEVMVERLDHPYWQSLRERLEEELSQEEIVIRAQEILQL
jgi:hypothetical protein